MREVASCKTKVVEFSGSDARCNDNAASHDQVKVVTFSTVRLQLVRNVLAKHRINAISSFS